MASRSLLALVLLGLASVTAWADKQDSEPAAPHFDWVDAPALAKMSDVAQIQVPEHARFAHPADARKFLEYLHNIPSGREAGLLIGGVPGKEQAFWFAIFEWDPIGFVRDDERTTIDADALLKQIQQATEDGNQERKRRGWDAMHVIGWQERPRYDENTHHLAWAILGQSEQAGAQFVNYRTRLLGRHGVMSVELVVDPADYAVTLPVFHGALENYSFQAGKTYAEYKPGDTVAKVGLTALIVGGAGAVAAKSGLLAKFWKLIVAGLVALFASVRKALSKLFGRGRDETIEMPSSPLPATTAEASAPPSPDPPQDAS